MTMEAGGEMRDAGRTREWPSGDAVLAAAGWVSDGAEAASLRCPIEQRYDSWAESSRDEMGEAK